MADMDKVFGGMRAVQLITTDCGDGLICSDTQHTRVAECVAKCGSCDRVAIATLLGSCTMSGHGTAVSYIANKCSKRIGPPPCTKLQQATVDQCRGDCRKCDVVAITKKVGECVLPNHELARNDLCVHIQPDLTKKGVCTPLQLAVIKHCTNNCHKCDVKDMQVVLAKCTISGI